MVYNNSYSNFETNLFYRGLKPAFKFGICILLSISFMLMDNKFKILLEVRQLIGSVIYPTQKAISVVPKTIHKINLYSKNYIDLIQENQNLHEQLTYSSLGNYQINKLSAENEQLKKLLELKQISKIPTLAVEILYSNNNPFVHKVIINKGSADNIKIGQAVINEYGVLGQVTKLFKNYAEVTLISAKKIMVPVQVMRNGLKGITYGNNREGNIKLNFIVPNSDVNIGDIIITSGLDGIYPLGLAVGKITKVSGKNLEGFLDIECIPTANIVNKPYAVVILSNSIEEILSN